MNRHRIFVFGCLGSIVLMFGLAALIYVSIRTPYDTARSRWDAKGDGNYTLVVSESCFCPNLGEYKITVTSGRVTAVDPVPSDTQPNPPPGLPPGATLSYFDSLTVAYMLGVAESQQWDTWKSPWLEQLSISYDPVYGYVTSYHSDPNSKLGELTGSFIYDAFYVYYAHDLALAGGE